MYFSETAMQNNSQKFGQESEEMARQFLKKKGYTILQANWRFKKYEIDIIGQINDIIVFFEVKARSTNVFGEPEEFVSLKKQKFIITAANHYLQEREIDLESRFDIISVLQINNNITVKHLEGAFYPSVK
jgi:putative endonuclease